MRPSTSQVLGHPPGSRLTDGHHPLLVPLADAGQVALVQVQIGVSRSLKVDMTGSVYAHGKYPGRAQGVDKLLKPGDWNAMRIEARGDTYRVGLNGTDVLKYDDPAFPNPGPIGLQVHGKVKMKVEFRNLRAKELPPEGK